MWRLFYDMETFLRCGDFSTIWRLFYDVETFLPCQNFSKMWRFFHDVGNFLQYGDFSMMWRPFYDVETFNAKSFLRDSNSFHKLVSMLEVLCFIRSAAEPYSVQLSPNTKLCILLTVSSVLIPHKIHLKSTHFKFNIAISFDS